MGYLYMKIPKKTAIAFAALFIVLNSFPVYAMDTRALPEKTTALCEAPAFRAQIQYSFEGYIVKGTFTEFTPDTSLVQPLYSLDGENYQICGENWDLHYLGTEDEDTLVKLQNQICLYPSYEPLKSYLAEELDCFYLKLRITRENGHTYETQPAVIDRGIPQPIPEGVSPGAKFSPAMSVIETRPFSYYGRYQLTISENATAEEISAYLPDTLPLKVDLETGKEHFADGIVNCPVTWKSLSLPRLTAGESVTIADAAEEIVIPETSLVTTPMGIFQLDEPLRMDQYAPTDEIRLVLNVISEDEEPTGVLAEENAGLEMSFHLKPTGATAIRAYTFSEGNPEWTEIPDLPLLKAVTAQPSTPNSGYTLVLHKTMEPYRSYLEAQASGDTPTPFFIGLKIEGGVYDGKQLILAWPDTYELPADLPDICGSGGNHNNASTGNEGDSTESGQRPDLPHTVETKPQTTEAPDDTKNSTDSDSRDDSTGNEKHPDIVPIQGNKPKTTAKPDDTENNTDSGNKNNKTERGPHPNTAPDPTYKPNTPDPTHKPNTLEPDDTFGYEMPLNQQNEASDASLLPATVAVIAVAGLCAASFGFATVSGKIPGKKHILRKYFLHR